MHTHTHTHVGLCHRRACLCTLLIEVHFWQFSWQGLTTVHAHVRGGLSASPAVGPVVPRAPTSPQHSTCSEGGCASERASTSEEHAGLAGKSVKWPGSQARLSGWEHRQRRLSEGWGRQRVALASRCRDRGTRGRPRDLSACARDSL